MPNPVIDQRTGTPLPSHQFPELSQLRLNASEIESLALQGHVSVERRGEKTYSKLRFRDGGKQRVRYIGDSARADAVRNELVVLQQEVQLRRDVAKLARRVTCTLRDIRQRLQPLFEEEGFYYHGHALRKRRTITT
jgi:hypothetical protein